MRWNASRIITAVLIWLGHQISTAVVGHEGFLLNKKNQFPELLEALYKHLACKPWGCYQH